MQKGGRGIKVWGQDINRSFVRRGEAEREGFCKRVVNGLKEVTYQAERVVYSCNCMFARV